MTALLAILLAAQAAQPAQPAPAPETTFDPLPTARGATLAEEARLTVCRTTAAQDAEAGIAAANQWLSEGGGLLARQCLGIAMAAAGRFDAALATFDAAAREAQQSGSLRRAFIEAQLGNTALAAGDPARARTALSSALALGTLPPVEQGLAHADRARAQVALGDAAAARADLDAATRQAPQDGGVWLLSATLARRMRDFARAQNDIQQAAALSPTDPAVALEAGNIAWMVDRPDAARRSWQSAIAIAPASAAAQAARAQLRELEAEAASPPPPPAP